MLKRDILESYSKHHDRKLAILEQDEAGVVDPARLASAVEALRKAGVWEKKGASFAGMISSRQYYFSPSTRKISGGRGAPQTAIGLLDNSAAVGADGTLTFASLEADPAKGERGITNLKTLISSLIGDYAGGATAEAKRQQMTPGSLLSQVDNDTLSGSEKDAITGNLESIVQSLPGYWEEGMSTEQKEAYGSIENYQSKFVGQRKDSFERKLLEDKLSLTLKDGEWVASERPVDGYQSIYVSKSLSDLVRVAAGAEPTDEDCATVLKDFALQKGTNRVIISPKGEGTDRSRALSFSDPQFTITNILRSVTNKCNPGDVEQSDKNVRVVDVRAISTGDKGNDNAIRGFMMEEVLEVLSLLEAKRGIGAGSEDLNTLVVRKFSRIKDRLLKLKEEVETWVTTSKFSGLSPEEAETVQQLKEIADGISEENPIEFDKNSLFGSMLRHSRTCLQERRPTFVLPVGTETKRGKRQDVLEVYKTREEAQAAASRMGVEIEAEEQTLPEALRDAPGIITDDETPDKSLAEVLEDNNLFEKDQKVYTLKVSLKNYKKFEGHGASMGGGRKGTMETLFNLSDGAFSEPFMQKIQSIVDIDNPEVFKTYADSVSKISTSIDGVGDTRFVTTKGNRKLKVDRLNQLAKTVNSQLEESGLDLNASSKELSRVLKQLTSQKTFSDTADNANYSKAREACKRYLEDKKLFKDLETGDEETKKSAKQYLATRMLHAGGSDDDNTLCDYRGLNTNDDIVFKQNDPLREAWQSILKDDGKWQLKRSEDRDGNVLDNGGYSLNIPGTKISINFSYGINPSKRDGRVESFFGQFETRLNKAALDYFNKLSKEEQRKVESQVSEAFKHIMLALSLLQEKVTVVEQ